MTLFNAPPTTDLPATANAVVFTTIPATTASASASETPSPHTGFPLSPVQTTGGGVSDTQQPSTSRDEREAPSNTDTSILPSFAPADNQLSIGEFDFDSSSQIINAAYEEIVHFKPNLFPVPSGSVGSQFVNIIAQLFQCFGDAARGEGLAIKTAMVATQLLLQQPHHTFDRAAHVQCLQHRLSLWRDGNIDELMQDCRYIQKQIKNHAPTPGGKTDNPDPARSFASLVTQGKVGAAISMLSDGHSGGVHNLDGGLDGKSIRDILKEKHPPAAPLDCDNIIQGEVQHVPYPALFASITRATIKTAVLNTQGAAGPSGMAADEWRRMCTSFKATSDALCDALASCARRIASNYIDPASLQAYVACRLIPLDKRPGVRPIGIGEVVRRIIGKAILNITSKAIEQAAGSLQLCAGQESGIEGAIHAMYQVYQRDDVHGVLLADASNAFNSLNRSACIANIQKLCPELHPVIVNTYRNPARLFVGGEEILSCEGTTQGDPLAMPMYALGIIPLIREASASGAIQSWYADDSTAGGTTQELYRWWKILEGRGGCYGYHINASKSVLLVKPPFEAEAREAFKNTAIQVRVDGCRHLGAALGTDDYCRQYVSLKMEDWCREVRQLAQFAHSQPQAAYAAFVHGLRHKWSFIARTMPNTASLFQPLEEVITCRLIPAITGRQPPGDLERSMLALPCRDGGMGLTNPITLSSQYDSSIKITQPLVERIIMQDSSMDGVQSAMKLVKTQVRKQVRDCSKAQATSLLSDLDPESRRALELAAEKGASSWLTTKPLKRYGFRLHKGAFRDALHLRYGWTPPKLPTTCACGKLFSVSHAMSCTLGGYPALRHNEIRDLTATMLREVAHDVVVEPSLQPLSGERFHLRSTNRDAQARLDVAAGGVWGGRFERTFIDVRVFNPMAPSNRKPSLAASYRSHEQEKRRSYERRVLEVEHGTFVPVVFSSSGGQGKAASALYGRIASMLADKRREPFSVVMAYIRTKLSVALMKSAVASLRGRRHRIDTFDFEPSLSLTVSECNIV